MISAGAPSFHERREQRVACSGCLISKDGGGRGGLSRLGGEEVRAPTTLGWIHGVSMIGAPTMPLLDRHGTAIALGILRQESCEICAVTGRSSEAATATKSRPWRAATDFFRWRFSHRHGGQCTPYCAATRRQTFVDCLRDALRLMLCW